VWQWLYNGVALSSGETVTRELVARIVEEEYAALVDAGLDDGPDDGLLAEARRIFEEAALAEEFPDFLTLPAYRRLLELERA
jgi:malate synthase